MSDKEKVSGEEVEVVAWLSTDCIGERYLCFSKPLDNNPAEELMTVAQHTRIVEALRGELVEQARLNGMGAERELALMAERDQLRAEVEREVVMPDDLSELLTEIVDIHRRRGVVLTIHIEQIADMLARLNKGAGSHE